MKTEKAAPQDGRTAKRNLQRIVRVFSLGLIVITATACLNPLQDKIDDLQSQLDETRDQLDEAQELPAIDPELGTIRGTFDVPTGAPADFRMSSVTVYSPQLAGFTTRPNDLGEFIIPNLEVGARYDIIATSGDIGIHTSSIGTDSAPELLRSTRLSPSAVGDGAGAENVFATLIEDVEADSGSGTFLGNQPLNRTGAISGYVSLDGETDHAGILVYIPGTSFSARTDSDGSFTIYYVPQGRYRIRFEKTNYTFDERADIDVLSEQESIINSANDPALLYYGYGTLAGTAQLQAAETHGNINVVLRHTTDQNLTYSGVTLDDGSFAIGNIAPGNYTALLSKDGYVTAEVAQVVVEGARTAVIEPPMLRVIGGSVAGSVTLSRGEDFAGIGILAERTDGVGVFSTYTNLTGSFRFPSLPTGVYTLTASRAGFSSAVIDSVVVEVGDEKTGLAFGQLGPAIGTITGKVILEGRDSHEGSLVTARNNDESTLSYTATTDTDGVFVVSDVQPGPYLLVVSHEGYVASNDVSVTVATNQIYSIDDIILGSSLGRVRGTVTLESGIDHTGTLVLAESEDGSQTYTASTSAIGEFSLAGMEPGRYRISSSKDGYVTSVSDWFELGTGQIKDDIVQELSISLRSIVGQVTTEARTDHAGIQITATNVDTPDLIYSALTNSDGFYALAGMQPGEYILSFSSAGYRSATLPTVNLDGSSSVTADTLELTRARGTVAGIATLEGRTSNAGINVTLPGTEYHTVTNADGTWEMLVPSGNYPGGVRFQMTDFALASDAETITILTDSTYAVPQVELAATHNTVNGTVRLRGSTDHSDILVALVDTETFSVITGINGVFEFAHVPVGDYTLRATIENAPSVEADISVRAADRITVETINIIPNAASIEGHVSLVGSSDFSGVTITVTSEGEEDRTATTNSSGYFYASNIPALGEHNIVFSNAGWDSQTVVVSDLEPLETRELGAVTPISLSDSTPPSWTDGVTINGGDLYSSGSQLTVQLYVSDMGSGLAAMAIQVNGFPETPDWRAFSSNLIVDLAELPVFGGNGEYNVSVVVRDASGNESTTSSQSIVLTDQVSTVSGVLIDSELVWTPEQSPYLIVGDILVESDKVLVIEPGVQVSFSGQFSIRIDGKVKAIGTPDDPILFDSAETYSGLWGGINLNRVSANLQMDGIQYLDGNIFQDCMFRNSNSGIYSDGAAYISRCSFDSTNRYALNAGPNNQPKFVVDSDIQSDIDMVYSTLMNSFVHGPIHVSFYGSSVLNTTFEQISTIQFFETRDVNRVLFSEIESPLTTYASAKGFAVQNSVINATVFGPRINFVNSVDTYAEYDFSGNYWGAAATEELELIGARGDATFVNDYYDDFYLAKANLQGWTTIEPDGVGYQGEHLIWIQVTAGPGTTEHELSVTVEQITDRQIDQMRWGYTVEDVQSQQWVSYTPSIGASLAESESLFGDSRVYVQVKDIHGNLSGVFSSAEPQRSFGSSYGP